MGGKQNRIVNTTIIILPGKTIDIPVSCMEAGRWNRQRPDFASGEAIYRARSRAVKNLSVASNLKREGSFHSDQGAVWDEVSASLSELHCPSPTSDFRAGREKVAHQIEAFVEAITPTDRQIGVVFLSKQGILGLELVATPSLLGQCLPKIVRSFAFEVLQDDDLTATPHDVAAAWWDKVKGAPFSRHLSPGAGEDLRVEAGDLIGAGLLWNNHLLHFSCFPRSGSGMESGGTRTRRASVSERRRQRESR